MLIEDFNGGIQIIGKIARSNYLSTNFFILAVIFACALLITLLVIAALRFPRSKMFQRPANVASRLLIGSPLQLFYDIFLHRAPSEDISTMRLKHLTAASILSPIIAFWFKLILLFFIVLAGVKWGYVITAGLAFWLVFEIYRRQHNKFPIYVKAFNIEFLVLFGTTIYDFLSHAA